MIRINNEDYCSTAPVKLYDPALLSYDMVTV